MRGMRGMMDRIKAINPKTETAISTQQALALDARITIGNEHIYFLATEAENNTKLYAARIPMAYTGGMQQLFWEYPIFSLPFKSTTIQVEDGTPFIVVPEDLFGSASPEAWLATSCSVEGKKVLTLSLSEERIVVIYAIKKELYDFCLRSFSSPTFTHNAGSQIAYTLRESRINRPKLLNAYIDRDYIQIVVSRLGELLVANQYKIASPTDCLYFITSLYRQFALDPNTDPIYLYAKEYYQELKELTKESVSQVKYNSYPTGSGEVEYSNSEIHPLEYLRIVCAL